MPGLLFVSYSGLFGGAERVLLDCATGVSGPAVLACPPGELSDRARAAGLAVLRLPPGPLELRGGARVALAAAAALARHALSVRRATLGVDADLVVTWGMRSAIAWRLARLERPAVIAHHDLLPGGVVGRPVRGAARRAAVVIVPSRAVARDLDPDGTLCSGRLRVVPPGVDPERFAGAATADPVLPPEVVVVGALVPWKRPDLALEVCALARRRVPDLRLRLVGAPLTRGGDVLVAALRRRAAEPDLAGAVELTGSRVDPVQDLARATCLLHCAPREPFGLAIVEALAAARPVVVPDSAGPREMVDGSCGWLYPPGDAAAAAAAVVEAVGDPARARRAGEAGRERVMQRFTRADTRAGFAAAVADPLRAAAGGGGAAAEGRGAAAVRRGAAAERRGAAAERRGAHACGGSAVRVAGAELTLVTVTHNSAGVLDGLLASAARHLPGAQVVVVDSASSDRSAAVARRRPSVEVAQLSENVGFGRACNAGVRAARGRVTVLLNPDVELIDDSLLELAAEALAPDRAQRLFAPRVLNGDGSVQDTAHPLPGSPADLARALVPPAVVPGRLGVALAPWRARAPRRVGWAVGCALVGRTDTLRALGPFDESRFLFGEDLDLGLHARRRGVETWLWPSARVVHHGGHATRAAFGGEPFERLAQARHAAVERQLGRRRARIDDRAQALTFGSRLVLKRAVGRSGGRERRQLAAVLALHRRA